MQFPQPSSISPPSPQSPNSQPPSSPATPRSRARTSTNASVASTTSRLRAVSIKFMEANPPPGMWAATGSLASKAPTLPEIRRGSFSHSGWNEAAQREADRQRKERRASESEEGGRRWKLSRTASSQSGINVEAGNAAGATAATRPGIGRGKRKSSAGTPGTGSEPFPSVREEEMNMGCQETVTGDGIWHTPVYDGSEKIEEKAAEDSKPSSEASERVPVAVEARTKRIQRQFSNGYVPPPKLPWSTSTIIGLRAFWKWFLTPSGFLITLYGLNVVAWGGMLFLLLCNAAPAMCVPTCNDINSPRRKWIEWDSQILNALFCVTGFGLAPWRFRDLYWWAWWRLGRHEEQRLTGIRRLAGIHSGWFRLSGSDCLDQADSSSAFDPNNPAVPIPISKIPDPPATGVRAPPTNGWKMDFVVWMNANNTFLQCVLCGFMWHYNRYTRPSWATGLFVALGCIAAGVGGLMMFHEGKNVKKVEGVPSKTAEIVEDVEAQVVSKDEKKRRLHLGENNKMALNSVE